MLNRWLNLNYALLGMFGGGLFPLVLPFFLVYGYSQYALYGIDQVQGSVLKTTLLLERAGFLFIVLSTVLELRLGWNRIEKVLKRLKQVSAEVGFRRTAHPHPVSLFIGYTLFNMTMAIFKTLKSGSGVRSLPEFYHFHIYNCNVVQYTDMAWAVAGLFKTLNLRLIQRLSKHGDDWMGLIETHQDLVKQTRVLHGCFQLHILSAILFTFIKAMIIPFQVIRNWNGPGVGILIGDPYINMIIISSDFLNICSLYIPATILTQECAKTRSVLRKFANRSKQRNQILSAIRILSGNELKLTFYGLINVNTLSFIPMVDAIATNLVILLNYK